MVVMCQGSSRKLMQLLLKESAAPLVLLCVCAAWLCPAPPSPTDTAKSLNPEPRGLWSDSGGVEMPGQEDSGHMQPKERG